MRVRLLNPVLVTVESNDPTSTRAVNPPGPDAKGYDDVWRVPIKYVDPVDGKMKKTRQVIERTFLAQVEVSKEHLMRYDAAGDFPSFDVLVVAHIKDLTARGFIQTDGSPVIQIGDRLKQTKNRRSGAVQSTWDDMIINEWRHASWGFGPGRDLILFLAKEREEPV